MKLILALLFVSFTAIAREPRPPWADRSSWIEDDCFFFVGVSPEIMGVSQGRDIAMDNGRTELMKSLNVKDLSGLVIQTKITWEDKIDAEGHIVVYRLMFVPMEQVRKKVKQ